MIREPPFVETGSHAGVVPVALALVAAFISVVLVGGARPASEASGLIAFTRSHGIYVMRADGTGIRPLRRLATFPSDIAWSPDGSRLAFATLAHGNVIWLVDADGSALVRLVLHAGEARSPTWSPDGRQIAYTALADKNRDIWVMNADGSNQQRLARTALWEFELDWSSESGQIAFTDVLGRTIGVINADGSSRRTLTSGWGLRDLAWAPDGRHIAFARDVTPDPDPWLKRNTEIYVMSTNGRSLDELTSNKVADFGPTWSPDGRRIVFVRSVPGGYGMGSDFGFFVMNADGTGVIRLTHNQVGEGSPAWQPGSSFETESR